MTYFSSPPLDERFIEQMFQSSLEALRTTREQVFGIAEAGRDEQNRLMLLLEHVQAELAECIELVDELEKKSREARVTLTEISHNFTSFSEIEIREAYALAERRMVELGAAREREKALRQRRDDLERQLKHIKQVLAKADQIVSQVSVALDFLTGNMDNLAERVQGLRVQAAIARQVIRAQEEERRRVALDIHEGPAQLLANMALRVDLVARAAGGEPEQLHRELRGMRDAIKGSLTDLRRIIFNLRPMALDDLGLVPTLRGYLDVMREQFGLNAEFLVLGVPHRLASSVEITLFRVAQEAINNAHRHSHCRRVIVRLEFSPTGIYLAVEDDGIGFDPERLPDRIIDSEHGFGLLHMRERVRLLRGEFRVISEAGRGTKVTVRVPWDIALIDEGDPEWDELDVDRDEEAGFAGPRRTDEHSSRDGRDGNGDVERI